MAGSVQITLPPSTQVVVQSFVNASYRERVTITVPGESPTVWEGTGFYDTPIGSKTIATGAEAPGVVVTVAVDHSTDGGSTWAPSQVEQNDCLIQYYHLVVVASEDSGDETWDDATTYFSWTAAPKDAPAESGAVDS